MGDEQPLYTGRQIVVFADEVGNDVLAMSDALQSTTGAATIASSLDYASGAINVTEAEAADRIAAVQARLERHVPPEKAQEQMRLYRHNSGTPEQVIESLRDWEKRGLDYAIVYFPDTAYDLSSLDLFAREVIPEF